MPAKYLLAIGKESSGDNFEVNLVQLPNLFITYSHDFQLPEIFISLFQQLTGLEANIYFALSLHSKLAARAQSFISNDQIKFDFDHHEFKEGQINSIDGFIQSLKQEIKKRKSFFKNKKSVENISALVVFIDDIFEVFKSKQKKSAIGFLDMLLDAAQYKIYFILGSPGIYRGLLEEVIKVSPALQKKGADVLRSSKISQILGAELVINPDGLLFFREKDEKIHTRLYPIVQANLHS